MRRLLKFAHEASSFVIMTHPSKSLSFRCHSHLLCNMPFSSGSHCPPAPFNIALELVSCRRRLCVLDDFSLIRVALESDRAHICTKVLFHVPIEQPSRIPFQRSLCVCVSLALPKLGFRCWIHGAMVINMTCTVYVSEMKITL